MYDKNREWLESKREFRYSLMRAGRSLAHIFYWIGIVILFPSILICLTNLPGLIQIVLSFGQEYPEFGEFLVFGLSPQATAMLGFVGCLVGFFLVSIGMGATEPYKFETQMPSTYIRTCRHCGEALPKGTIGNACPNCGTIMPMGLLTYAARLGGLGVTYINYILLLTAAALVFAK